MTHLAPHLTQNWHVTKPGASGRRGIVVSQSRDAALAGVSVLDSGGNAVDAAIATALALAAVEPWNSGLGAIGHAIVHHADEPHAHHVGFGPRAPRDLDPARFPLTGAPAQDLFGWPAVQGDANIHGPLSFTIPSSVAGFDAMHRRWGKVPVRDLIAPALALARRGLPADWFTTLKIANSAALLRQYPESARIYLPHGLPPLAPYQGVPGTLKLGQLSATLERLQSAGLRDLYDGDVAASIVSDTDSMGGVLNADDLRGCAPEIALAQTLAWRGYEWQTAGGLTAAPTLMQVVPHLPDTARPDPAWFAALARAMRAAYADRLQNEGEGCTTHLTVCDAAGTMVSLTTTLLSSMGSRVVLPGSGILMNNGVMWFDPVPGRPNSIAPGRRALTNMCPVILQRDGRPVLAAGASGGRRILAAVIQTVAFVAQFGMTPEEAAHHPRLDVSNPDGVQADQRLPSEVIDALRADGPVELVEHGVLPVNFACPNLIVQHDGHRTGVSDVMSPWSAALAQ